MIDLLAISAIERDTEISYVRRERDWLARAQADGRGRPRDAAAADAAAGRRRTATARQPRPRPSQGGGHGGHAARQVAPADRMSLPQTVPYLGWRWDDLVFLALAGVLLGSALMVVLSRNIIRSGLFMVLSFLGARRHLRADGRHAGGRGAGAGLHRRHQRAHPVRGHAHPVQGRAGAAGVPPPGMGRGDRVAWSWACCSS